VASPGAVDPFMGIIVPYTNFFLFLVLLYFVARKPLSEMARQRRDAFSKALTEASAAKEKAEARLKELQQRLSKIDAEIKEIKTVSRQSANTEAARIVAEGSSQAEALKAEAKRIKDAELSSAITDLRKEIVATVTKTVQQQLENKLDHAAQQALISRRTEQLSSSNTLN
jgi:F-type H+-transporting ATPase subunit b